MKRKLKELEDRFGFPVFLLYICTKTKNDYGSTRRIMENYKKCVPVPIEEVAS